MQKTYENDAFEKKIADFRTDARVEDNLPKATMALLAGLEHTWYWLDAVLQIQPELLREAGFSLEDQKLLRLTYRTKKKWEAFVQEYGKDAISDEKIAGVENASTLPFPTHRDKSFQILLDAASYLEAMLHQLSEDNRCFEKHFSETQLAWIGVCTACIRKCRQESEATDCKPRRF